VGKRDSPCICLLALLASDKEQPNPIQLPVSLDERTTSAKESAGDENNRFSWESFRMIRSNTTENIA